MPLLFLIFCLRNQVHSGCQCISALSLDRDNFHGNATVHLAAALIVIAGNRHALAHADGFKARRVDISCHQAHF